MYDLQSQISRLSQEDVTAHIKSATAEYLELRRSNDPLMKAPARWFSLLFLSPEAETSPCVCWLISLISWAAGLWSPQPAHLLDIYVCVCLSSPLGKNEESCSVDWESCVCVWLWCSQWTVQLSQLTQQLLPSKPPTQLQLTRVLSHYTAIYCIFHPHVWSLSVCRINIKGLILYLLH